MTEPDKGLGRFVKTSSIYAVGNVLNSVGSFLLLPLYTNYLSVGDYGALELLYASAAVIMGLLSIGIAHATLRFYYEYADSSDRNAVVSTNLIASFVIAATGVGLLALAREPIVQLVFGGSQYERAFLLVLATLLFDLSTQVSFAYLRAREYAWQYVWFSFAKLLVQIGLSAYFLVGRGWGIEGVLLGHLLAVCLLWLALTGFTLAHCGLRFHAHKLTPILIYSAPFLFTTVTSLISTQLDRFLLNSYISLQAVGLYALAAKFGSVLSLLVAEPFNRSYGAYRFSIMNTPEAPSIQARVVRYLMVGSALLALAIAYFTGDILRLMSQPEYWGAADVLPVLLFAAVIGMAVYPLQTGILYQKKSKHIFYIGVATAAASALVNFLLIPAYGVFGAAWAQLAVAALGVALTHAIARRYFPVTYDYAKLAQVVVLLAVFLVLGYALRAQGGALGIALKLALWTGFALSLPLLGIVTRAEIGAALRLFTPRRSA